MPCAFRSVPTGSLRTIRRSTVTKDSLLSRALTAQCVNLPAHLAAFFASSCNRIASKLAHSAPHAIFITPFHIQFLPQTGVSDILVVNLSNQHQALRVACGLAGEHNVHSFAPKSAFSSCAESKKPSGSSM